MIGEVRRHQNAVFYHMWSEPHEGDVFNNIRTPVVLSIATLRACNPKIPIYVFDNTRDHESFSNPSNWGGFESILNFKVIEDKFFYKSASNRIAGWKHLSRIPDIHYGAERFGVQVENIIYSDTDVFWLQNPMPLDKPTNKFCFDAWNSGFYYYNKKSANTKDGFMDVFKSYTSAAIYSTEVRKLMKKHIGYDEWYGVWDEMILTYMFHNHPELFHRIENEEHGVAGRMDRTNIDKMKMIHFNGVFVPNEVTGQDHCRGLMCIIFKEYWRRINKVLEAKDIERIFTQEELDFYLPKQTTIKEATKTLRPHSDGHYHISDLWN